MSDYANLINLTGVVWIISWPRQVKEEGGNGDEVGNDEEDEESCVD
jgi:hypothetical protein